MSETESDPLHARIAERIGKPLGSGGPALAPDPVNLPMIRHWVDAFDDHNPVYLDESLARSSRFGEIVAPPAMLQTWTMPRPSLEGIAERGGSAGEVSPDSPFRLLGDAGYSGTLATNSELEFERYLRPGDVLRSQAVLESISDRKTMPLGTGYFVTWVTTYTDAAGEVAGRQRFRILKFRPGNRAEAAPGSRSATRAPKSATAETGEVLSPFELRVTATRIVAGAIASRDFMPVHHDRDQARAQGAPDLFMNILTSSGYISRFLTDWAGPEARLRRIAIRLGAPTLPGHTLRFAGRVAGVRDADGERVLDVAIRVSNDLGDHATGTVVLGLPV